MTVKVFYWDGASVQVDKHEGVQAPGLNPQLGIAIINNADGSPKTIYTLPRVIKIEADSAGIVGARVLPGPGSNMVS